MQMKLSKLEISKRLLESSRDNCINWRGAALRSGDNVLLQPADGHGCPFVGQLIDVRDGAAIPKGEIDRRKWRKLPKRMALVRWLPFVEESDSSRPAAGDNCHLPYSMKEVSQSTMVEWISVEAVLNICFVFHIDAIQKGLVSSGGMDRFF
jgi:hypothetical protein